MFYVTCHLIENYARRHFKLLPPLRKVVLLSSNNNHLPLVLTITNKQLLRILSQKFDELLCLGATLDSSADETGTKSMTCT